MHTAGLGRAPLAPGVSRSGSGLKYATSVILRRNRKPRARTKDLVGLVCHGDLVEPLKASSFSGRPALPKTCSGRLASEDLGSRASPVAEPLGPSHPCPT